MKMIKYYLAISIIFALLAAYSNNMLLTIVFGWIALSVFAVTFAYLVNKPHIFRKRADGSIPSSVRWFFIPFLLGASLYNSFARRTDKVPAVQKITDEIFLACRLFPSDIDLLKSYGVTAILDVTAEFDGMDWSSQDAGLHYLNIPVLDHTSPTTEQLRQAIFWIDQQVENDGKVVIHCALGRGRSVLVTAAYLLSRDDTLSVVDAMNQIQSIRATARLNKRQLAALREVKNAGRLRMNNQLALIVNPVAGGGKWAKEKTYVLERLETHFDITIYETTESITANSLAEKAVSEGHDLLIACGGDGTLTEVADVLCGSQCKMGIIPMGTANALSMVVFGTGSKFAPISTACDVILSGVCQQIDTAVCNDKRMLLVCAVGIEADMIIRSDRGAKDEKGQLAYLQHFFDATVQAMPQSFEVCIDDASAFTVNTQSFVVANAAPPSTVLAQGAGNPDICDGLLDLTWFKEEASDNNSFSAVAGLTVSGLLDGQHSDLVEVQRCQKVQIKSAKTFDYVIDGEPFKSDELNIRCDAGSLNLLCAEKVSDNFNS
ncbi:diacylglycerol kinase family protein [Aliiglaciecola sp. M165]|uniref:diacylglycerol kinase family protein n=1 Tax=Aliiglaciecola sp. M165 TaxID=2593649 RepID=UPI00117CD9B9|nr:diacylglycerol kinase family protein [Aliiglaciecola sp. M165]TRY29260.1 hypothetical protein FM019_17795 [Aliiglaciecola sp. M165]